MEKKRWVFIFSALCLALVFSVSSVEGQKDCDADGDFYVKDTNKCRKLLGIEDIQEEVDCNDNLTSLDNTLCGDEDTTSGKKSIALIMKFDDMGGDNVQSDRINLIDSPYVDKEGAGVSASERSAPNKAASIDLGLNARGRGGRQLFLNITCDPIELFNPDGTFNSFINGCPLLPLQLAAGHLFPDCAVGDNFCSAGATVRPYKVSCPGVDPLLPCPDIFTMPGNGTTELMSYRLSFGGGVIFIEVASAIGGDGGLDPGRCLSLLETSQRSAFIEQECDDERKCNVEVAAFDRGNEGPFPGNINPEAGAGDGENDAWRVVADGPDDDPGVTALICNRNTSEVLGKATLFFGFQAIKKEGAIELF